MSLPHQPSAPAALVTTPVGRARSNYAEVARAIGPDIIAERHSQGAALPGDAELTSRFGMSRTVLRESVKTLAAKGLRSTKARVGTVVQDRSAWNMLDPDVLAWYLDVGIDAHFLRDLADIRLAVEPRAARLAAERRSEADLRLHLGVATASANPFMRSIGGVIEAALRASFILSAPVAARDRDATLDAHHRIVEAIAAQDAEAASAAMVDAILNGLRRYGTAEDFPGAMGDTHD